MYVYGYVYVYIYICTVHICTYAEIQATCWMLEIQLVIPTPSRSIFGPPVGTGIYPGYPSGISQSGWPILRHALLVDSPNWSPQRSMHISISTIGKMCAEEFAYPSQNYNLKISKSPSINLNLISFSYMFIYYHRNPCIFLHFFSKFMLAQIFTSQCSQVDARDPATLASASTATRLPEGDGAADVFFG
jgi:hypothetical protein